MMEIAITKVGFSTELPECCGFLTGPPLKEILKKWIKFGSEKKQYNSCILTEVDKLFYCSKHNIPRNRKDSSSNGPTMERKWQEKRLVNPVKRATWQHPICGTPAVPAWCHLVNCRNAALRLPASPMLATRTEGGTLSVPHGSCSGCTRIATSRNGTGSSLVSVQKTLREPLRKQEPSIHGAWAARTLCFCGPVVADYSPHLARAAPGSWTPGAAISAPEAKAFPLWGQHEEALNSTNNKDKGLRGAAQPISSSESHQRKEKKQIFHRRNLHLYYQNPHPTMRERQIHICKIILDANSTQCPYLQFIHGES